ncbi:hypothetical protein HY628_01915 [Candidatus Uhrbacteria bacterium]|nr:hypothetical protein [Candidatus Uhrbacteria bacterium]
MRLSGLQKYILKTCLAAGGRLDRQPFEGFYQGSGRAPRSGEQVKIITRALERLIDREMLIGSGLRTPHKWYIKEVKLTAKGRKTAKELLGQQVPLPLNQPS